MASASSDIQYDAFGAILIGYGIPSANNSGCINTITTGSCAASAKRVFQITGGMWDKLYKGAYGEVRVGVQYSYSQRELFQGSGTTAPLLPLPFAPKQNDQAVLTSFRYYPSNNPIIQTRSRVGRSPSRFSLLPCQLQTTGSWRLRHSSVKKPI